MQTAVLVFLKSLATPVVLYADDPMALYAELKQIMAAAKTAAPKVIEKPGMGPLKVVSFLDTELGGCALQQDPNAAPQQGPSGGGPTPGPRPQAGPPGGPPRPQVAKAPPPGRPPGPPPPPRPAGGPPRPPGGSFQPPPPRQ